MSLGASAAENEFRTLAEYFVETAEYVRTMRGEVGVVSGRKGSGKTAIFFRARDSFREQKALVTDLKPESHQLSLFRHELLKLVDIGAFDHTLAAFWYFVILSELLLTLKREQSHRRHTLESYRILGEIDELLRRYGISESGDFTSRLNRLGNEIARKLKELRDRKITPSPEMLTNIVFASGVAELRAAIIQHTTSKDHMVLLFDNIDKGWPTNGVNEFDVRLVRLLLEALDKVRRDFNAAERDFKSVVFLRNDIYELLLELTPDRGKAGEIRIDWTDREKLRQVIFRRLQSSLMPAQRESFEQLWNRLFVEGASGRSSFEYFLDHCLMRPRFLINIIENALANGINRGHEKVTEQDCIDAVRQHSLYLMDDFGYEIRDVSGISSDILYAFIGVSHILTEGEIMTKLAESGTSGVDRDKAFKLLLWYGVIGVADRNGHDRFIYDYEYNVRRLEAEIATQSPDVYYVTNPAIHVALNT